MDNAPDLNCRIDEAITNVCLIMNYFSRNVRILISLECMNERVMIVFSLELAMELIDIETTIFPLKSTMCRMNLSLNGFHSTKSRIFLAYYYNFMLSEQHLFSSQ